MEESSKLRIIIDTNIWISFLIGKRLSSLFRLFDNDKVEVVTSDELIEEIVEVADRPKFSRFFTKEKMALLMDFIKEDTIYIELPKIINSRCRDPKDDHLLELAVLSDADYLITGDKDLLSMKSINLCRIITASDFDILAMSIELPTILNDVVEEYYTIVIA